MFLIGCLEQGACCLSIVWPLASVTAVPKPHYLLPYEKSSFLVGLLAHPGYPGKKAIKWLFVIFIGCQRDVIILDADNKDVTCGMSSPPAVFAEVEFLKSIDRILKPTGKLL